ncbi:hypothetical protein SAMN06297422_11623 [Lachnospiraceae bacterium]|nr:hypothetical protein SAMN06297422_11623 [Lachnospiraceae bacterium]
MNVEDIIAGFLSEEDETEEYEEKTEKNLNLDEKY